MNLTLEAGQHVGMVGRNGCGKSTLLKLMAGLGGFKPDSGQVQIARGASVGYLAQDHDLVPDHTLRQEAGSALAELDALHRQIDEVSHAMAKATGDDLERLMRRYEQLEVKLHAAGGYATDHLVDQVLHGLGLTDDLFDVKVRDLSGGQKGRLALAKLLLSHPDVLLLDEPTNHLDIAGRQWLEGFLAEYSGAVLLVSHDRWVLDRVVTKIYELEDGRLVEYPGNYQKYRELRAERRLAQQRAFEKQQTASRHEQAFIARYKAGQRAKQAKGREKRLERFKKDQAIDRPIELETMKLTFKPGPRASDNVITAEGLGVAYDTRKLFDGLTVTLKRGDTVGIIGPNGAGKSTLVRCLLGEQMPTSGTARLGSQVSVGHYRQTHEHLDLSRTVVEYLRPFTPNQLEQEARDLAGAFLFSGIDQDKPLRVLSGGERSRAVRAGLVAGGHNLLVLDEPTNHLDIPSAERLEEALRLFSAPAGGFGQNRSPEGTLIIISHDRMLLDNLCDQLLILDGRGGIRHFLGTYSEYLETEGAQALVKDDAQPVSGRAIRPDKRQPKAGENKRNQKKGNTGKTGKKSRYSHMSQAKLEQAIEQAEARLAELDALLADPETYRDHKRFNALHEEREQVQAELKPMEEEWLRRAEQA
ncbi:MAG: ABC-F family ATP-binding cassette domain-containing protein [Phycisphaeraceae bacterium]